MRVFDIHAWDERLLRWLKIDASIVDLVTHTDVAVCIFLVVAVVPILILTDANNLNLIVHILKDKTFRALALF